ncbi:MAG: hypothetical protein ACYSWU_00850 [Planctomycetota bacterium]
MHTPGPWTAEKHGDTYRIWSEANGIRAGVADILIDRKVGQGISERETANADLIAAAPDLFDALTDAEFILRKLATNPKEIGAMADTIKRSASFACAALAVAEEGTR